MLKIDGITPKSAKGYSNTGYINRFIKEFEKQQYSIHVHCRESVKLPMLTSPEISICTGEETALVNLIKNTPLHNFLLNDETATNADLNIDQWFEGITQLLAGEPLKLPDGLTFYSLPS
jgi:hypothetical protein